jgi:hypothetical protein
MKGISKVIGKKVPYDFEGLTSGTYAFSTLLKYCLPD